MQTLRWTGIAVFAVLGVVSLVYAVIALTEDWAGGFGANLADAALLGVSAVLLWRRPGWRRVGVAFGLLILGVVVLYVVLVQLRAHGYFGGTWAASTKNGQLPPWVGVWSRAARAGGPVGLAERRFMQSSASITP